MWVIDKHCSILRRLVVAFAECGILIFLSAVLPAQAQTFTVLYSFKGAPADGATPNGHLIQDAAGNLYGTTGGGGRFGANGGNGTIFKLDPANNEKPLYSFGKNAGDGTNPITGLVRDAAGNLYGTTKNSGAFGYGVVFKFGSAGMTVLHSFGQGGDGESPQASVVRDCCGNLYGTTAAGGNQSQGTVFRIDRNGNETVLHSFWGGDGSGPEALLGAGAGVFYGTTIGSASSVGAAKYGTIYRIDSTGKETVLYDFKGTPDGEFPGSGLARDAAGNLFGTTHAGGAFGLGTVFRVDSGGNETVLYSFIGGASGQSPLWGVVLDSSGNIYCVTEGGGNAECSCGVVFKLDPNGNQSVLHAFVFGTDGTSPGGPLLIDAVGSLYGANRTGGTDGFGTVYKITQ